jgi:hypothetical protein
MNDVKEYYKTLINLVSKSFGEKIAKKFVEENYFASFLPIGQKSYYLLIDYRRSSNLSKSSAIPEIVNENLKLITDFQDMPCPDNRAN